jgi:hypothetical protein
MTLGGTRTFDTDAYVRSYNPRLFDCDIRTLKMFTFSADFLSLGNYSTYGFGILAILRDNWVSGCSRVVLFIYRLASKIGL